MNKSIRKLALLVVPVTLGACSNMMMTPELPMDVPVNIAVPAGNKLAVILKGEGMLTYECRMKAGTSDVYEFSPPAPDALLKDKSGMVVGKYYPGPTWEHNDGSKVTGKQLAVFPMATGIALQLVQANPATGNGAMTGVSYIQRLNTVGGKPEGTCGVNTMGSKSIVKYLADYYFYKAA